MVIVPILENQTKRQAEGTLTSLGFKIGEIEYKPHFAKDAVLALKHKGRELKKGDKLSLTSVIDLVLGDGKLNYGENPTEVKPDSLQVGNNEE